MGRTRGFTLLEVLVALAIFALVAASLVTASARSLNNAARLEDKTLTGWLADNQLSLLQLQEAAPAVGREVRSLEYAGRRWWLLQEISSTSDPGLLRVTLWLAPGAGPGRAAEIETAAVQRLVGFLGVAR